MRISRSGAWMAEAASHDGAPQCSCGLRHVPALKTPCLGSLRNPLRPVAGFGFSFVALGVLTLDGIQCSIAGGLIYNCRLSEPARARAQAETAEIGAHVGRLM